MAVLAVSVFATAGTIHYQTPALALIGTEFHANAAAVGWVATLSFAGFLAGTILLVPLGDRIDKRWLILGNLAGLIISVLAMAAAPSVAVLAALSFVTGVGASVSQHIVPLVAELARPNERGRAVGTVLSGLFLGILFARVVGGLIASHLGWRWMYVISALMMLAVTPALVMRLPSTQPQTRLAYPALIRSLVALLRQHAELRYAAAIQFLLGVCYGGFWATLAPMLMLMHGVGPAFAGLVGIPGAAGIFVSRPAGHWMDRRGVVPVVRTGVCLVMAAFAAFAFAQSWIGAVFVGAVLLDCGLRAAMVANQTLANAIAADARSRSNTVFAAHVWGGNATGAFLASTALTHGGWLAVCAMALIASGMALLVQWSTARRAARAP